MYDIFRYQGYHFLPVEALPENADFFKVSKRLRLDAEMGLTSRKWGPKNYSWEKFYKACDYLKIDIFYCLETRRLYIPCTNELFIYLPEEGSTLEWKLTNLQASDFLRK